MDETHQDRVCYGDSTTAKHPTRITNIGGNIIDIRRDCSTNSLAEKIRNGLHRGIGEEKCLPSLTLWDDRGLELFEKVTHLPDYYLSWMEREILHQSCHDIAQSIDPDTMLVDLGCG